MLNAIPFVGWFLDFGFKVSLAIPFYIIWTGFGIGEKYFSFLPDVYQSPGFWNCVGLFMVMPIIYGIFLPKFVSVEQTNNNKD